MNRPIKSKSVTKTRSKETGRRYFLCLACAAYGLLVLVYPSTVFAADAASNAITTKLDALYGLVAGIVSSIGMIFTLWGISEWGIAFQTSEGSMQAQAFKKIAGGMIMVFAPQLVPIVAA